MMAIGRLALISLLLGMVGCEKSSQKTVVVNENVSLGVSLSAGQYSDIFFSSQPSDEDFEKLKEQGFAHIINLRGTDEYDEAKEKKAVEALGLHYTQLTFPKTLTSDYIQKVTQAVLAHRKAGKTLIHCSSGNRVAIWVGGHFYKDHKYSKRDSIEMAKKMGLRKQQAIERLQSYLSTQK